MLVVAFATIGLQTTFLRNFCASAQIPLLVSAPGIGSPIDMVLVHAVAGVGCRALRKRQARGFRG
jgi:hypothetical protein